LAGKNKKTRKTPLILRILTVIVAFCLFLVPLLLGVIIYFNAPAQSGAAHFFEERDGIIRDESGKYYIEVRSGENAMSVGRRLESAGLIRNRYFWYLLCRFGNEHLKTGTYRLEMPANQIAIYRLLVSGVQILHRVTIPEGVTLKKMARILEDANICFADDFLAAAGDREILDGYKIPNDTMEGYLFPDTYMFPSGFPAASVLKTMADNFFEKLEKIEPSVINMNPGELNKKVILASIIEREYRVADEAPIMAGVFNNRLNIGMALQSCATVEYIITEIQNRPHPSVILNRDLEIISPYNTYLVPGLPPGPISAPGAVALSAALKPQKTEFFYFRLDDPQSGRHYFSKTIDEHIKAGQLLTKSGF